MEPGQPGQLVQPQSGQPQEEKQEKQEKQEKGILGTISNAVGFITGSTASSNAAVTNSNAAVTNSNAAVTNSNAAVTNSNALNSNAKKLNVNKLSSNAEATAAAATPTIINILSSAASASTAAAPIKAPAPEAEPEPEGEVEAEEAEEAQIQEQAVRRPRAKREIKPTDSKSFFKARSKDVSKFAFTPEGDLRVPAMGGEEAKVITLPFYSQATVEEIKEFDSKRQTSIHEVEQEYDELSRQLTTAMEEWKSSGDFSDAIRLQKELLALDSRRTNLRSPLRWGKTIANPSIKSVQMHETAVVDEKHKDRKLGYPVMTLVGRPYTFEQTVLPRKELPKKEVAQEVETTEETFILFSKPNDPEYGLLSPETPVEFVYNTTKYTSILQAYHVERATQVGRTDMRATLLKLTNPKTIRITGSRIVGREKKEIDMPLELVTEIVKSLVLQDPRFTPVLKKTGTDTLIYAEQDDKLLGIGISAADENSATNSSKWNGAQNLLGKAWEAVRRHIASIPEEPVQSGGAVLESGRTVRDVKESRSKVLMGYYRRKN
jgi:predicted NAD-dependent protein-ADP-ribosyltransferase YbiA (DUF1768 family)